MYQFSRALYRELAPLVAPDKPGSQSESNQMRVLRACEASMERLMVDRRYFAHPSRTLFNDIRAYFSMANQARVYSIVTRNVELADHYFADLPDHVYDEHGTPRRCQAMTRKSTPCARHPLPRSEYCPSHQHLTETLDELNEPLPFAA